MGWPGSKVEVEDICLSHHPKGETPTRTNYLNILFSTISRKFPIHGFVVRSSFRERSVAGRVLHQATDHITGLHVSARRRALAPFNMPAMSPTMTEGGIASWKKGEGESFSAGDVLLEIVIALFTSLTFLS